MNTRWSWWLAVAALRVVLMGLTSWAGAEGESILPMGPEDPSTWPDALAANSDAGRDALAALSRAREELQDLRELSRSMAFQESEPFGPHSPFQMSPGPTDYYPAIAFNPQGNEFTVLRESQDGLVRAQRLSASGIAIGEPTVVSLPSFGPPAIAYSPISRKYIVVSTSSGSVWVTFLNEDGTPIGAPELLDDRTPDPGTQIFAFLFLDVVWRSAQDQFLVVWAAITVGPGGNTWELMGELRECADGRVAGDRDNVVLRGPGAEQFVEPALAYSSIDDAYWFAYGGAGVFGFGIDGDLTAMTTPVIDLGGFWPPSVAWNPNRNEYVVATGLIDNSIALKRIRPDGSFAGPGSALDVSGRLDFSPELSFNPTSGSFLVSWMTVPVSPTEWNKSDIVVQELDSLAEPIGTALQLTDAEGSGFAGSLPDVSCNTITGEWLVAWVHSEISEPFGATIWGQILEPAAGPPDDTTPPSLVFRNPVHNQIYTNDDSILLDVEGQDPESGVPSTVADVDGAPVTSGQGLDLVALGPGEHRLTVTATNGVGLSTTRAVDFFVQEVRSLAGDRNPGPTVTKAERQGVVALQLAVERFGAQDALTLDSVAVRASGSGDDSTELASVYLALDANRDGLLDAGDTPLGAPATFAADDGAVAFGALGLSLPPDQSTRVLVFLDMAASAVVGNTFSVRVEPSDVVVQGPAGRVPPRGTTAQGPTLTVVEGVPPTVEIVSPTNRIYEQGTTIQISVSASDNVGVALLVIRLDDGEPVSNGQVLDTSTLTRGTHILEATATDLAGNTATDTVGFIVGTPQASLQQTADGVAALLTDPTLSAAARQNIQAAVDLLAGNNQFANNGAIQKMREGNLVTAFVRVQQAIAKLRRAQGQGADTQELQGELAEFVHDMLIERVHEVTFALGPEDPDVLAIREKFFEGEVRLLAGDYEGAVLRFRQAQQLIQGVDASGAGIEVVSPFEREVIQSGLVPVVVEYTDALTLAVRSTFHAELDGQDVTPQFTTGGFEATASLAVASGTHTLVVSIADSAGNVGSASRTFYYGLSLLVDIEPVRVASLTVGDLFSVRLRTVDALGRPALVTGPVEVVFTGVSAPGLPFPDTTKAVLVDGQAYLAQVQSFLVAGTQQVTATYVPNPLLVGAATTGVSSGPPCEVTGIVGDGQVGTVNEILPVQASFTVTDTYGNPVADALIAWTVTQGGATFVSTRTGSATATTSGGGLATSPPIQLGPNPGHSVVVASLGGVQFVVTALNPIAGFDDDGDGVANADEGPLGTDSTRADSDGDGLIDSTELALGTSPLLVDTDGDGLSDYEEVFVSHTDPLVPDSGMTPIPDPYTGETRTITSRSRSPIRLGPQEPRNGSTEAGDAVVVDTGEKIVRVTDMTIPGRGFDFEFTRTYRSRIAFDGPIGQSWDFNYNAHLDEDPSGNVTLVDGGGRKDTFVAEGAGGFTAPPGHFLRLETEAGGFVLRAPQGTEHHFSTSGRLSLIQDRNGNQMSFLYDAAGRLDTVLDTLGRPISFFYTFEGRLQELRDFAGRSVLYGYNPDGDLVTVRSPIVVGTPTGNDFPGGKTVTYAYHTGCLNPELNHNLLTVEDAKGQVFCVNAYDAEDRVTKQFYGTGVFTFDHDPLFRVTKVKDRRGTVTEFQWNAVGNVVRETVFTRGLRPGDPASFTTTREFNTDQLVTRTLYPRGNSVEFVFDSANPDRLAQANLVDIVRKAIGIPGDQAEIKVHVDYEPQFQLPKRVTDPRDGGAPGRFTTTYVFDYELGEGTAGNVVQVLAPTVTEGVASPQTIVSRMSYNARGQLTSTEDPEGNITDYFYFPEGDPSGNGDPSARTQGPGGYVAEVIVDARDNGRRSESAPLAQISNAWTYDEVGNPTSSKDGRGRTTIYVVNTLNQVVRTVSRAPFSYVTDYYFDEKDNVVRVVRSNDASVPGEPASYETRYEFDLLNNLERELREEKPGKFLTTRYVRNANEMIEEVVYPEGNEFGTEYDERDLVISETRGCGCGGASTKRYFVDGNGNVERVVDGTGDVTTTEFDGFDRARRVRDGVGGESVLVYDAASNVIDASSLGTIGGPSPADRSGARNVLLARVETRFDEVSRPYETRQLHFDARTGGTIGDGLVVTKRLFDRAGRVTRVENDNGHGVDVFYDGVHRQVLTRDELGNEDEAGFDANSNRVTTIERERPSGGGPAETFTSTNVFDELDRLTEATDPGGHVRKSKWDSRGNRVRLEDAEGNVTRWALDGLDRVTRIERDLREGGTGSGALLRTIVVKQAWDGNSRLSSTTDDRGNTTTYHWDGLNRQDEVIYADKTTRTRRFTRDDRIEAETDQNGTIVRHFYDHLDRLTERVVSKSRTVVGTTFERFEWDGLSRLSKGTDDDSVVETAFDSLSRVIEEAQNGRLVRTLRDGVGNPVDCTYPGGRLIHRAFDALERTERIEEGAIAIASYEYKGTSRPFKRTTANGIEERTDYDADRRVTSKVNLRTSDNAVVAGFQHAYNAEENKLFEKLMHPSSQGAAGSGQVYRYDSLYRVAQAKYGVADPEAEILSPGSSAFGRKVSYDMDGVGNWSDRTETDGAGGVISSVAPTVNEVNEYLTFGPVGERHDDNGNRTELTREIADGVVSTQLTTYDFKNRPIQVWERGASGDTFVAEYRYDVLDRRIEKQAGGVVTRFFWDGWRLVEEQDAAGGTVATYVCGANYIDEHVAMDRGGRRYYFHANTLYSTAALTDELGNVVERYSYDIYGMPTFEDAAGTATTRTSSAVGNPYLFTGQRWDPETRLFYYRARYLDPAQGRFTTRDPIPNSLCGGADVLNQYSYVLNRPTRLVDPSGEQADVQAACALCAFLSRPGASIPGLPSGSTPAVRAAACAFCAAGVSAVVWVVLARAWAAPVLAVAGRALVAGTEAMAVAAVPAVVLVAIAAAIKLLWIDAEEWEEGYRRHRRARERLRRERERSAAGRVVLPEPFEPPVQLPEPLPPAPDYLDCYFNGRLGRKCCYDCKDEQGNVVASPCITISSPTGNCPKRGWTTRERPSRDFQAQ